MSRSEFIGHCFCSWRLNKLKWHIQTADDIELNKLYEIHKSLPKNQKYQELEIEFQKRLA
jgi:hypothetical protein